MRSDGARASPVMGRLLVDREQHIGDEVRAKMIGSAVNTGLRAPVFFPLWDCLAPTSRLVMGSLKSAKEARSVKGGPVVADTGQFSMRIRSHPVNVGASCWAARNWRSVLTHLHPIIDMRSRGRRATDGGLGPWRDGMM